MTIKGVKLGLTHRNNTTEPAVTKMKIKKALSKKRKMRPNNVLLFHLKKIMLSFFIFLAKLYILP